MKARIKFRKYGCLKFIGHLDVMRYFQKVMRRADIPIAFTEGYSPHMIMSFAQPLGIGLTSDGEYLDIELKEPVASEEAVRRMNAVMAEGIEVVSFVKIPDDKKASGMTITAAAEYRVTLLKSAEMPDKAGLTESPEEREVTESAEGREAAKLPAEWRREAEDFLNQPQIRMMKKTKSSEKEIDIKPMIYGMEINETDISLLLAAGSEQNLKPDLVMEAFLRYINKSVRDCPMHYHRIDVYARDRSIPEDAPDAHRKGAGLVPLEALGEVIRIG